MEIRFSIEINGNTDIFIIGTEVSNNIQLKSSTNFPEVEEELSKEVSNKIQLKFQSSSEIIRNFPEVEKELSNIVIALFVYEALLKDGNYNNKGASKVQQKLKGNEKIKIQLENLDKNKASKLGIAIQGILSFCLDVCPDVIVESNYSYDINSLKKHTFSNKSVGLFSGGADSFAGFSVLSNKFSINEYVFVSHGSTQLQILLMAKLKPIFDNKNLELVYFNVSKGRSEGVQQLRGLLYMTIGSLYARTINSNKLVVAETGPTMIQPPYDILDEVTLTTHPFVIRMVEELYKLYFDEKLTIQTPFKDMTKAEALSLVNKDNISINYIKKTNSCRNTMFANSTYSHCGKCLGCIVRRISMILSDFELPEEDYYAWNVFVMDINEKVYGRGKNVHMHFKDLSNIIMLGESSRNILLNKWDDISSIKIKEQGKENLFKRFALDFFTVLYLLYDKNKIGRNEYLKQFYIQCKKEGIINENIANGRLNDIANNSYLKINEN